jgi:hypothetical protein
MNSSRIVVLSLDLKLTRPKKRRTCKLVAPVFLHLLPKQGSCTLPWPEASQCDISSHIFKFHAFHWNIGVKLKIWFVVTLAMSQCSYMYKKDRLQTGKGLRVTGSVFMMQSGLNQVWRLDAEAFGWSGKLANQCLNVAWFFWINLSLM